MMILRVMLLSVLFWLGTIHAEGVDSIDVEIEADIHSSLQMKWHRITQTQADYQQAKSQLKLDNSFVLLPYGVFIELQTNDKNRKVFLQVERLVSTNKIDSIGIDSIYISHNGNQVVSAKQHLSILESHDWGKLKQHVILFAIKKQPNHKPGQYLAKFKFINNTLP
jgi:hypothetical protein